MNLWIYLAMSMMALSAVFSFGFVTGKALERDRAVDEWLLYRNSFYTRIMTNGSKGR